MSVVIIGGNECMVRRYTDLCKEYRSKAKCYPKMTNGIRNMGSPDLLILLTNTMSHKMVKCALNDIGNGTKVARCHGSSMAALKNVLDEHVGAN